MNILIAGVGGQGTLLASRVLGNYASLIGYDCKLSEVHGMAQRGGSVVTYIKMGEKIYSPLIADGDADVLLAFEKLEAYRWSSSVKEDGIIIVNLQEIMPLPVIVGQAKYPNDIMDKLHSNYNTVEIDALKCALECGTSKAVNTVMIGRLTKCLNLDMSIMKKAVEMSVPEKFRELNLKALEKGYNE